MYTKTSENQKTLILFIAFVRKRYYKIIGLISIAYFTHDGLQYIILRNLFIYSEFPLLSPPKIIISVFYYLMYAYIYMHCYTFEHSTYA